MSIRIVIVGGVAGGMSAATRARRVNEHASIIVLEKGGFISFANCGLPYHLAGDIPDEQSLLITNPHKVAERFRIDARVGHEVASIDRANRVVHVRDLDAARDYDLPYDKLILAVGAAPLVPPIDHVHAPNVFFLRSMEDTQAMGRFLDGNTARSAVIVGAGFIGLEMAEALSRRGLAVTVIDKSAHPLPPLDVEMASFVADELAANQVKFIGKAGLKSLEAGPDGRVVSVLTDDGRSIATDLVLLSIGVRPNVGLARESGLLIGTTGAIAVDDYQRTSDSNVYAVGDVAEVVHGVTGKPARIPLAGPANRLGRLAGEHAATGTSSRATRILGTAIVRTFHLDAGLTGLNEAAARAAGYDVDTAYALPADHASYYPGSTQLRIKLIYDKPTGKLLGAQVVGRAGVDKRIDVLATALHFGATIDDLTSLDLAYAPQFASAKDALHQAAMVAQNQRRDLMPASLNSAPRAGDLLLDVRTPAEFAAGTLAGAANIPIDELRGRLSELDHARPITLFCQAGARGYLASRILRQSGFAQVRNLKGGYVMAMRTAGA